MHVLVVEDEERIREYLVNGLKAEGHTAQGCATYPEAEETIEGVSDSPFDLVMLDRMLEDKDGGNLIPLIKKKIPGAAILILSAIGSAEEKAELLDKGADDYVAKPFSLVELSARLRALGRRTQSIPSRLLKFKNCEVDLVDHQVKVEGKKIELSQKEYQLLMIFIKHPGRVYNRFQLLDQVWNAQYDIGSNVVEVTINNVRRKLETAGSQIEILSKRNVGYWVEA